VQIATFRELYKMHDLLKEMDKLISEASAGKGHYEKLGIWPFWKQHPNFDKRVVGAFMETFFGGRSGIGVRHQIRRCVLLDFLSEYPTVIALTKLQWLMVAKTTEVLYDSPAAKEFLQTVTLKDLKGKAAWKTSGRGAYQAQGRRHLSCSRPIFRGRRCQ
jgi:hypothetical protein